MNKILLSVSYLAIFLFCAQAMAGTDYNNPVDGKTYVAPQGWKTYSPQNPAPIKQEKVMLANVRLLTAQNEMESSVAVDDLTAFVRSVVATASKSFASSKSASDLLLQFDCSSSSQTLKIAFQGNPERDFLQNLYDEIGKMPRLKVTAKPVAFQVQISVKP